MTAKTIKKMTSLLTSLTIAAGAFGAAGTVTASADSGEMRDMTTAEIVRDMGIGINLGNTFEACGDWIAESRGGNPSVNDYETAWGSVTITEDIIRGYAEEGFGTLRIPVAWSNMMADDGSYTVNADYLARVKQVADWALDSGMYVIINEHWDYGWMNRLPENKEEGMKKYLSIWSQVADSFKDYGDHLIFESQNEELGNWCKEENGKTEYYYWNRWSGETVENGKQLAYDLCNEVNQSFVDLIRQSGGNNDKRHLLISGFNTDFELTCDDMFKMPDDPAGRMAVSVHYYTPYKFALTNDDKDWGSQADHKELNKYMDMVRDKFVSNGVPVIIGECCAGMEISKKTGTSARDYFLATCEAAYTRGMCPVLWDITYSESQPADNQIYNRRTRKMQDEQLKAGLQEILSNSQLAGSITVESEELVKQYKGESFALNATVNSGAPLKYTSSNENVATVDENGTVTIHNAGSTTFTITADATETYTAAATTVSLIVEKLSIDPNAPADNMQVPYEVEVVSAIGLPEGWVWTEDKTLEVGVPVTVTARCEDSNYATRSLDITITRLGKEETPAESIIDEPSVTPNVGVTSENAYANRILGRHETYQFRAVQPPYPAADSSSAASSAAASTTTATTAAQPATASDASPDTGSAVGLSTIIAVLLGASYIIVKKNK